MKNKCPKIKFARVFSLLVWIVVVFNPFSVNAQCWNKIWYDEFDNSSLDLTKWSYETGDGCPGLCGFGNNENEYYTSSTQNVSVSGGYLNITARYSQNYNNSGMDFTSGKINTRGKFDTILYGRIEANIKLPAGTGLWPAFWMLPTNNVYGGWPTSGEIDIMENRGDLTNRITGTLHYGQPSPNNEYDSTPLTLSSGDFVNSFHLFAVEWQPGEIRFYVDNTLYKTETQNPNSLNPASNSSVTWPWDQNFYIILNLAMGGWYAGNPSTATIINGDNNYTRTMQVDYVRVYKDASNGGFAGTLNGNSSVLQNETGVAYSIDAAASATYNWTVTGGTIASGSGTNAITVDWGTSDGSVSVVKTLSCGSATYSLPVTVQPTPCGTIFEDFENIRQQYYGYINGVLSTTNNNPSPSVENTSPYCAKYIRNSSEQYDVLIIDSFNIGNVADFKTGLKKLLMDVYSSTSGKTIQLQFENSFTSAANNYPTGRHSTYIAKTTKSNSWETLEFLWSQTLNGGVSDDQVNRLTILFEPNAYTSDVFYFDNIMSSSKPSTTSITGTASVCQNAAGKTYSVTGSSGSTYAWTVPSDASITSSTNANSITVNFGVASGNITVQETNTLGCTGDQKTLAVSVSTCTGILNSSNSNQSLSIYPNPSNSTINIQLDIPEENMLVLITDQLGREVKTRQVDIQGGSVSLDINDLPQGLYILKMKGKDRVYSAAFSKF